MVFAAYSLGENRSLEFLNALQLKFFSKSATATQVAGARALVDEDLKSGVVVQPHGDWKDIFAEAVKLAEQHTGAIGYRS